jgi:hypothetical protein
MVSSPRIVLLALSALAIGCATAAPADPASPSPGAGAAASASPASPASSAATAGAATAVATTEPAASPAPRPGVLADSSLPAGVSALAEAEQKELAGKCKKLVDAIAAIARKDGAKKRPIDYIGEVLANPPKLPGTDVPRCSELLRRDTVAYLARSREGEARVSLKTILVGLMSAIAHEPPELCASAPAVPASLDAVKDKPYASTGADWSSVGWKCVRFDPSGGPQVFQYELRTDAKARSYEIIARGYPVQGGAPTELYIAGKVENGAIDPSSPLMRR